ncbi:hypothetical protein, partial [Nocardioides pelophilus]|uniref:hypothetical protein n=1 Tax=Nocardioides pelophilus TaxID=2172019 RepID=UPI001C81524D
MRRAVASLLAGVVLAGTAACGEDRPAPPPDPAATGTQLRDRPDKGAPDGPVVMAPPLTRRFVPARGARELAARVVVADDLARAPRTAEDVRQAA